jgi:hypothetical protein
MFPDGKSTLVECDAQNRQGPGHIDIWRLALDGTGKYLVEVVGLPWPSLLASIRASQ